MGEERADNPRADACASGPDQVMRQLGARDVAQVSRFIDILRQEVADLRHRLRDAEQAWQQRQNRSQHDLEPPVALVRLREQLGEAQGLLASLRKVPKRAGSATTRATGS
jgi:hypothetical protein